MNNTEGLVILLTYLAVSASAISGALEARKHEMDIVGATTVAFVTAFGGGTLRDLLLGRTPIFWLVDPGLTIATFGVAVISFYLVDRVSVKLLDIADALGLGFFSILGATFALQMELSLLVVSLMGVVTGVFGGILRDVLCNKIPHVFRRGTRLYATCSFTGTWIFILLVSLHVDISVASWVGTFVVFGIRAAALRYRLTLPFP
ncbi:MAG: trimeric intracellular cation channel family protein [Chloroflexi bacterium]|nr:trimeric intracellular cation channel family protein [Chloroflexota bacterium]